MRRRTGKQEERPDGLRLRGTPRGADTAIRVIRFIRAFYTDIELYSRTFVAFREEKNESLTRSYRYCDVFEPFTGARAEDCTGSFKI